MMGLQSVTCYLLLLICVTTYNCIAGVIETCHTETFKAECADDEVIVMTSARYGRMKIGRCVKRDIIGDLGCQSEVISIIDKMCSGRQKCQVRIPDAELNDANKCDDELKSYLESSYTCFKVVAPMNSCSDNTPIKLTEPSGFLSSYVASMTRCGLEKTPWILQAKPGQLINITFYEFNLMTMHHRDYGSATESQCSERAFIMDKNTGRKVKICPQAERVSNVYVSSNYTLDVTFRTQSVITEGNHFLIHYKFIGCPDKVPPTGMVFHRTGTMAAKMSCLNSQQTFDLVCKDGDWTGEIENCTVPGLVSQDEADKKGVLNGLLVVVLVAVCFVLVCIIVAIFVFCIKRLRGGSEPLRECTYEYEESPYSKGKMTQLKPLHVEMETRGGHCGEGDIVYKPFIQKVPPNGMIQNQIGNGGECLLCGEQGSREMIIEDEQNIRNAAYSQMNIANKNPRAYNTVSYSPKESNIENDRRLKKQQQKLNTGTGAAATNNRIERPKSNHDNNRSKTLEPAQKMVDPRMMNQTYELDPSSVYPRNYACAPAKRVREPIYVTPPSVDMLNNTL